MKEIRVKKYNENYKNQVVELILNIQIFEFNIPITVHDQPDLMDINNFYQKGTGNFWIAMINDKVIGTIALIDIGNKQVALRKMFVHQSFRGKEKGVAQSLLETAINWCVKNSVVEIYLGTTAAYYAAHRFYEKNKFTEISKNDLPDKFPIMDVDSRFYKLSIF